MERIHTFPTDLPESCIEVIDGSEEGLDVQYESFCHLHAIEVLPVADVPQHLRYTGSTALLECAENGPYPVNLCLDMLLLLAQ